MLLYLKYRIGHVCMVSLHAESTNYCITLEYYKYVKLRNFLLRKNYESYERNYYSIVYIEYNINDYISKISKYHLSID